MSKPDSTLIDSDGGEPDDLVSLLGAFGSHAEPAKRAHAERLASMAPTDKRRKRIKPLRPKQFNVRVSEETLAMATSVCELRKWSQGDLVEAAIVALHTQLIGTDK
jgi:hypothetical protein